MDTVTKRFAEFLRLPEPPARYLLALFLAYAFAVIYRILPNRTPSSIQSLYFTVTGFWTLYFVFGTSVWHSVVDITAVYTLLVLLGPTLITLTLTWILTMGHLIFGYAYVMSSNQIHPIFWTIPHCVLVLKLIGLAFSVYDGKKSQDKLSNDERATCLTSIPSFIDVLGYCYNCGTVLAGPQFPFKRYQDFVSGKLFSWSEAHGSCLAGLHRLFLGVLLAVFYTIMNSRFPLEYMNSKMYSDLNIASKLFYMVLIGNLAMRRYVAVWLIAEGACIMTGISYNGRKSDGSCDWSGVANVKLMDFELSISFQGVIDTFNIQTNNWVKCYVFKRLKWMNNRTLSHIFSLLFVSLWHGLWVGYLLNFSLEFIIIKAEQQIKLVLTKRFGLSLKEMSWFLYLPSTVLLFLVRNIILSYALQLFMLLSWQACFKFMTSVYFIGHVAVVVWFLLFFMFLKPTSKLKTS